jgi:hypothetical protein
MVDMKDRSSEAFESGSEAGPCLVPGLSADGKCEMPSLRRPALVLGLRCELRCPEASPMVCLVISTFRLGLTLLPRSGPELSERLLPPLRMLGSDAFRVRVQIVVGWRPVLLERARAHLLGLRLLRILFVVEKHKPIAPKTVRLFEHTPHCFGRGRPSPSRILIWEIAVHPRKLALA